MPTTDDLPLAGAREAHDQLAESLKDLLEAQRALGVSFLMPRAARRDLRIEQSIANAQRTASALSRDLEYIRTRIRNAVYK